MKARGQSGRDRKRKAVVQPSRGDPTGRRQEILDASLDLFARQGFQGTSVREIARAVGVNEATLYHYFESKAEILDAIIDLLLEERSEALAAADDRGVSLEDVLRELTMKLLARFRAEREQKLMRLLMIEGPRLAVTGRYPVLRLMRESGERVTRVFETLMKDGRARKRDPQLTGLQFTAPIFTYGFHQHALGGKAMEPMSEAAFAKAHAELFARALAP
ncbi:MAG: TetR/AcrR family transcriptional regulator [Deltaproteobacteria bacterium]|nr:TetR/AcrR family transcriptional regulator [Deltaproteobacteria bacterium]